VLVFSAELKGLEAIVAACVVEYLVSEESMFVYVLSAIEAIDGVLAVTVCYVV